MSKMCRPFGRNTPVYYFYQCYRWHSHIWYAPPMSSKSHMQSVAHPFPWIPACVNQWIRCQLLPKQHLQQQHSPKQRIVCKVFKVEVVVKGLPWVRWIASLGIMASVIPAAAAPQPCWLNALRALALQPLNKLCEAKTRCQEMPVKHHYNESWSNITSSNLLKTGLAKAVW